MLELWGMRSDLSMPSLLGPLWPGVITPERVLSIGQIEQNCILLLNWIVWNGTVFFGIEAVYLCSAGLFERELFLTLKLCVNKKTILINWIVWNFLLKWLNSTLNAQKGLIHRQTKQPTNSISLHTVKWLMSSIFNESVWHKSLVPTEFKCQTALFNP